jgi:hypothetical protein
MKNNPEQLFKVSYKSVSTYSPEHWGQALKQGWVTQEMVPPLFLTYIQNPELRPEIATLMVNAQMWNFQIQEGLAKLEDAPHDVAEVIRSIDQLPDDLFGEK